MRKILIAAVFATAALIVDLRAASAAGGAPWCGIIILDEDGATYEDCRYQTLEACVANVLAGLRGTCSPNPAYLEPDRQPRKSRVKPH